MKLFLTLLSVCVMGVAGATAQKSLDAAVKDSIQAKIASTVPEKMGIGNVIVKKATVNEKKKVIQYPNFKSGHLAI